MVAAGLVLGAARLAAWQCPDGTPPPCVNRPRGATRVVPPPPSERARRFVVIPFRNLSRSPELEWLVEASTTLLGDVLGRWREITVVPEERLLPALQLARLAPGELADLRQLRRVAEATGGWTAVTGEMLVTGGRVVVRARALDVVTGRPLARASVDGAADADIRDAFSRVGAQLLRAAGLDTTTVDLGAATTPSLDAYRAYARGIAQRNRSRYRSARAAFAEAVRHDSVFAQAWFGIAQTALFENPLMLLEPGSEGQRAIATAARLAERLAPADRDVILGVSMLFQGRFGAARDVLRRLMERDSTVLDAAGWLGFLEYADPVLVETPAGFRRRGSLQATVTIAQRLLHHQVGRLETHIALVYTYLLAAGDLPIVLPGYAREVPFDQLFTGPPRAVFVPLLRDTIETVPVAEFLALPPDTVAGARRRALVAARTWAERWLAAGPTEGAAHQALARVEEVEGRPEEALRSLARADSLGVEFGFRDMRFQRLGVLVQTGRFSAAAALADSLWRERRFARVFAAPTDQFEALRWSFLIWIADGDPRADSAVAKLAEGVAALGVGLTGPAARIGALSLLSGRRVPPFWLAAIPLVLRLTVLDRAHETGAASADPTLGELLARLTRWAVEDASADSAAAERLRRSPWHRP
jgi:TolB-like protein